jgi:exo-beta-1,3-glucanase (GH17 family)
MLAGQVNSDVAEIARRGFKTIRIYSTDCSALQNIGSAAAFNGIQLIVGVYISNSGVSGAQEQVQQIVQWAQWSLVELIAVGNEAISDGYTTAPELASFIESSRSAFKRAGYAGLVTTTEPLDTWQTNAAALCDAVDVVGCNIHPFFNRDVSPSKAGDFVVSQLKIVDSLCQGKTGLNLETGWPSAGVPNGLAVPGLVEQSIAIRAITAAAGNRSIILSFANDEWKQPGSCDCEQHWGAIQLFSIL